MWIVDVPTANGSRYLQQLCRHWSHKFSVTFTETEGEIGDFVFGPLTLRASPDALTVAFDPLPDADVDRARQVIANHLDRFAFREAPLSFDWR